MKKLQFWSICLLIVAVLTMAVSCSNPSDNGADTTEAKETVTIGTPTNEETPGVTDDSQPTNTAESENVTTVPEETKADIRPGNDADHTWEGFDSFGD